MKINEVEARVGVTKKNIRFYEEKGLIAPRRNSENGYREYGTGEVEQLKQIKLLRKLGVPLEEIRRMQSGAHTVGDGMRRHLVTLERERQNLERSMELCRTLKDWEQRLDTLEADGLLERMEEMEREGTTFKDKQREDAKPVRYAAAVAASLIMVAFMAGAMALMAWGFTVEPEEAPPLVLMAVLIALPGVVILGVLYALYQRIREIQRGRRTMRKTTRGKGLVYGTAVAAVIAGLALLQSLGLAAVWGALSPAVRALALAGAAAQLAAAVGVTVALFHRWKEIRGGEEDEAKKY